LNDSFFRMSCVVPGCKSGYGTKSKFPPGVSKHHFPKDKASRDSWQKAIPREDWTPTDSSVICSLHFEESDFLTEREDQNNYRKKGELKLRRLKKEAIPRRFPNCPSYLSTKKPKERSETSTSTARRRKQAEKAESEAELFLGLDSVESFEELSDKLPTQFPPSWSVTTLKDEDKIVLEDLTVDEDGKPTLKFSLTILKSLEFVLSSKDVIVPTSKVKHITLNKKIQRHSDVLNILAFLNSFSDGQPNVQDVINYCISKLSDAGKEVQTENSSLSTKIEFLIEQLKLSIVPPGGRRYSARLLWTAITWMKTGPAVYRLLLADGSLTLPTFSHLHRLSNAYTLETGLSSSTIAYLQERIKPLTESEKTVELLIDEVRTVKLIK
jgi:hypothetical protein